MYISETQLCNLRLSEIVFLDFVRVVSPPNVCITYLLTYLIIYSMEQCHSWEANRFSASHEIPRI